MRLPVSEELSRTGRALPERAWQVIERTRAVWQVPTPRRRRASHGAVRLRLLRGWRAAVAAGMTSAPAIAHSW